MSKMTVVALAAALVMAPLSVRAGDSKDEKTTKETSKEKAKSSDKSDDRGGFKGFWIHKIGGTIGNGLKGGADKIAKAF